MVTSFDAIQEVVGRDILAVLVPVIIFTALCYWGMRDPQR